MFEAGLFGLTTASLVFLSAVGIMGSLLATWRRMKLRNLRFTLSCLRHELWRTYMWRASTVKEFSRRSPARAVEDHAERVESDRLSGQRIIDLDVAVVKLMAAISLQDLASASTQVRQVHERVAVLRREGAAKFQAASIGLRRTT